MEDYKKKYELGSIVSAKRTYNGEIITGEFGGFHLLDKSNPKSIVGVVHATNGTYDVDPDSIESVISEDERIRKTLINIVKGACNKYGIKYQGKEISEEKLLAFLEKQDPKKHEEELEKAYKTADEVQYKKGYEDAKREFEKQGEQKPVISDDAIREGVAHFGITQYPITNWLKKYIDVKKQSEQKSTDKVEPKFKVGDWIIHNKNIELADSLMLVTGKDANEYLCKYVNGQCSYNIEFIDKNYHLWTIKDAKIGDVLANKNGAIFINAGSLEGRLTMDCYCYLSIQNEFYIEEHKTGSWFYKDDIKPATKEQRELLFSKMKEAGYEWDSEKKELKKIEQKPSDKVEPKFKVKYAGNEYNVFETKELAGVTFYGIEDEPTHIDYVLPENCEIVSDYGYGVKEKGSSYPTKSAIFSKQKPAWSEEDKKKIELLIAILEVNYPNGYFKVNPIDTPNMEAMSTKELVDWLKSLKERYTWKPSDEQMKALNYVINLMASSESPTENDYYYNVLKDMRTHLKKLREE